METSRQPEKKTAEGIMKQFLGVFEKTVSNKKAKHVLIVDDEPSVRRMVGRSMTTVDRNLEIHEAENGREALDALRTIRETTGGDPVLIVTDLQMPVMDGWEFINQLWEDYEKQGRENGIPIIVLSASSGSKGIFGGTTVHGDRCKYSPLVAIAKEECIKPMKYDGQGEEGLHAWLKRFLR